MTGLAQVWGGLDARRRAAVVGATLAILAAVLALARPTGSGEMALLYAGLEPGTAGEVVAALAARGVAHEVRGDAVWVAAAARDLERVTLAAQGLPAPSARGYELLDGLSGFGTTAQMFDAAYWRAKEGELARTILAVPGVRTARVHISAGGSRPFRAPERASAAVTVATSGGPLPPGQARALRHLVAAAVAGLDPGRVAVIDAATGLVADAAEAAPDSRADALRERALRLVEARVGPGNAVVEVAVETVTETETVTERRLDPESRVAISTEMEETETSSRGADGPVTVASNLPDGDAAGTGTASSETTARTTTNYDLSETSREVLRAPGAVRRLTVAVLVNDLPPEEPGGSPRPRSADELAALGALVASAVGLDEGRGDAITVRSMPFEGVLLPGSEPALPQGPVRNGMALLRPLLLAAVALGLGLFVLRPLLRPPAPTPAPAAPPAALAPMPLPTALPSAPSSPEEPAARLRRLIEARGEEAARLLETWIETGPARAGGEG
ncbi:flagellar basal-body MS-ring/collar protein FliF [Rubellimicrobium sp. CFH 75288]|uniref:flagellar basal-body MS-ring/collar protein FliF n=1 Tax=Rubellimicrobium sp. CFH 75288 TaxID=2697034 RepID=UPI0014137196|nr:flagellar basal-body MS-ring/collar protein FliF [Rubellimicrobium sp. CFH 75288]NAZ37277.1 flagellar M-ring protein FliF [Rubellimicrobium sp. CFH 75288]